MTYSLYTKALKLIATYKDDSSATALVANAKRIVKEYVKSAEVKPVEACRHTKVMTKRGIANFNNIRTDQTWAIELLKSLPVKGTKPQLNGVEMSKTAIIETIAGMAWTSRTLMVVRYNTLDLKYEGGFKVFTFKSNKAFEESIYCLGGKNYLFKV